ncbi:MAG: cell wall hydrolase [Bacillota bacterium]
MNNRVINIIALTLIIVLIAPTVNLFLGNGFSIVQAQGIDEEKAVKGLIISGLLVFMLDKMFDDSSVEFSYEDGKGSISVEDNDDKAYWLSKAIHAEARGEPYKGKVAVGAVILNRVKSPEFPNTIYSVIHQKGQFSSVKDGQIKLKPNQEAHRAAKQALEGDDPSRNALYFYNPIIAKTLWWLTTREKTVQIGDHVFAK